MSKKSARFSSELFVILALATSIAACSSPASPKSGLAQKGGSGHSVSVSIPRPGRSAARDLFDGEVGSISIIACDNAGQWTGPATLTKHSTYWSGSIDVGATGLAYFGAYGRKSDGSLIYSGKTSWDVESDGQTVEFGMGIVILMSGCMQTSVRTLYGPAASLLAGSTIGSTDGATGPLSSFSVSYSIATDGNYIYVADRSNHKIRRVEIPTGKTTTIATLTNPYAYPTGITTDGTNLYIVSDVYNTLYKMPVTGGSPTTLATYTMPFAVACDGNYVYVGENNTTAGTTIIYRYNILGETSSVLSGGTNGDAEGEGNSGADTARYSTIGGLVSDGSSLYVSDQGNSKIRKVDVYTGNMVTQAFTGLTLSTPYQITKDGEYLYIADYVHGRVCRTSIFGGALEALGGYSGGLPTGVTTDGVNVYVFDIRQGKIFTLQ